MLLNRGNRGEYREGVRDFRAACRPDHPGAAELVRAFFATWDEAGYATARFITIVRFSLSNWLLNPVLASNTIFRSNSSGTLTRCNSHHR